MSSEPAIHHCITSMDAVGGMITYIRSLLRSGISGVSERVFTSLQGVDQSRMTLLHAHDPALLLQTTGQCPALFTAHVHLCCPSGSKYLEARSTACDRRMSVLGCVWGHLVDHCGSRRPDTILEDFSRAYGALDFLKRRRVPVIANSDFIRNEFLRHGLKPEQVATLRYGISLPKATPHPLAQEVHEDKRILFVGRVTPLKGLSWLLKALSRIDKDIHLDVAGDGYILPEMKRLAESLGLQSHVTWHGWCDSERLKDLYDRCFALVVPSMWHEPAGIVTLEAYAHSRPVIASAVGGLPEYVADQKTGILVPNGDIEKLAAAISELSIDYERCRRMGEDGYHLLANQFGLEDHIKELQKLYERCIQDFQARAANA